MTESKRNMANDWEDKDDVIPDMTGPYWVDKFAKSSVSRGRPKILSPKISTTIRFDADVLARFRAGGAGWQSRINDALREWLDEHGAEA